MRLTPATVFLLALCPFGAAAQPAGEVLTYRVNNTDIRVSDTLVTIGSHQPQYAHLEMPGREWPPVSSDESGNIFVGAAAINTVTGRVHTRKMHADGIRYPYGLAVTPIGRQFRFERGAHRCRLHSDAFGLMKKRLAVDSLNARNLMIVPSDTKVLALATYLGHNKEDTHYRIGEVDLTRCRFTSVTRLGNPDLLVELGWSKRGGWWIAGSIEQTLLRSSDGKRWRALPLPKDVYSIISAYAKSKDEIWLAAGLAGSPNPYLLTYTTNGGKTWSAVQRDDHGLNRFPTAWLDGHQRLAEFDLPNAQGKIAD